MNLYMSKIAISLVTGRQYSFFSAACKTVVKCLFVCACELPPPPPPSSPRVSLLHKPSILEVLNDGTTELHAHRQISHLDAQCALNLYFSYGAQSFLIEFRLVEMSTTIQKNHLFYFSLFFFSGFTKRGMHRIKHECAKVESIHANTHTHIQ